MEIKNNQINIYQYIEQLLDYLHENQSEFIDSMGMISNTNLYINRRTETALLASKQYPEFAEEIALTVIKKYKAKSIKTSSAFIDKLLMLNGLDIDGDGINLWILLHTYDEDKYYINNTKVSIIDKIKSFFKKFRR